jgi:hypothetical protein
MIIIHGMNSQVLPPAAGPTSRQRSGGARPNPEREAEEAPSEARKEIEHHFVDTAEEVLERALVPPEKGDRHPKQRKRE